MNRKLIQLLQLSILGLDFFILNIIYFTSQLLFNDRIPATYHRSYFKYWLILNFSWLLLSWAGGVYSEKKITFFESFMRRSFHIYILWITSIVFYLFFSRVFELSRFFILTTLVIFGIGLLLNRFAYIGIRDYLKKKESLIRKILIVGYNEVAKRLSRHLEREELNIQIVGYTDKKENIKELTNYPVLIDLNHTLEISKKLEVNEIFSTISPEQNTDIYTLMKQAEIACIKFRLVPDFTQFIQTPVHFEFLGNIPVLSLRKEPLDDFSNRVKKRLFDIIVSLFVIVFILSWLMPLLGILIYIESPGPIFFSQLRSGKNNKPFKCLKFRSMRFNIVTDEMAAVRNDKRITKIGKFIRRTSLDEFPQFINVLKGQMSLVGPRPHMLKQTEHYSAIIEQYMVRQFLKPGITGWAQVNGYRGEMTAPDHVIRRVEHDIWYLENWSIWMDIRIMFLTVYNIFKGEENAY